MPILRHGCGSCGSEKTDLYQPRDPKPYCCGRKMGLLMPTHVVGRCKPDSNGVHAGSGFARSQASAPSVAARGEFAPEAIDVAHGDGEDMGEIPQSRFIAPPVDPNEPGIIPPAPTTGAFAKDYEQCSADERDERWRDSAQALAAWTATGLEKQGESPTVARDKAADVAQQTITKARAESTRADGLT